MAIQLYRKGNTHVVRGLECELKVVSLAEMYPMLEQEWVTDPSELYTEAAQGDELQPIAEPEPENPEQPAKKRGRPAKTAN